MPRPILMVHGAFCGGWTFERFRRPFEAAGHAVSALDLPGHAPGQSVTGLSMSDYARAVIEACRAQPEPPVVVGHSLGGLVAQLAARDAGAAGLVLLAPSPPWGVAGASVEEAITAFGLQMMGPVWMQAVEPDPGLMRGYSLNRLPRAEREAIVGKLTPESGRALWETLNWWWDPLMTTSVGPGPLACPAYCMVGEIDVVHPPATVRLTAERIGAACEEFAGMSHWLPGEPGWERVADRALGWIAGLG